MKQLTLTFTLLFAVYASNACIVYTDLQPDSLVQMSEITNFGIGGTLDFNNDGDFESQSTWIWVSGFGWSIFMYGQDTTTYFAQDGNDTLQFGQRILSVLTAGQMINSSLNWGNNQNGLAVADSTRPIFAGQGDKYVGIRFNINGQKHYGWILISFDSSVSNRALTIKSFAYESEPGKAIAAGDTGTVITALHLSSPADTVRVNNTLQLQSSTTPSTNNNNALYWSVSDTTIATISSSGLLTGKTVGSVTVTIIDSCSGISRDTIITVKAIAASIISNKSNSMVEVYPNPVQSVLTIDINDYQKYDKIELYSMVGRLVSSYEINSTTSYIDMNGLHSGHYFIMISGRNTNENSVYRIYKAE